MYIEQLHGFIDWKRQTFHIYHENGEAQKIEVNEEGEVVLEVSMFKQVNLGALKGFIEKLSEILSKDQIQTMFQLWGNSNAIKISIVTASLDGDRLLAKRILQLGVDRGVLAVGTNSTWKVVNKEEQKTMKEHAERMKKGISKELDSPEDILSRMRSMEQDINLEGGRGHKTPVQGGSDIAISMGVGSKTNLPVKKNTINTTTEERTLEELSEQELQKELSILQQKLKEDKGWNENETPWTVNDKIHKIQAQLKGIQLQKDAKEYKEEVNKLNEHTPKSMTRLPVQTKPITAGSPGSQKPPTRKPLQSSTPVIKKRS